MKNDAIEKMIDSRIYMFITGEIVLVQPLLWGGKICPPPPPLCVQMDFTRTFEAKAKCNKHKSCFKSFLSNFSSFEVP